MGLFGKIASMVGGSPATPAASNAVKEPESQDQPVPAPVGRDLACFDFENELPAYFVAERRIEMAGDQPAERERLFAEFGIRDERHLRQIIDAYREYASWVYQTQGERAFNNLTQIKLDAEGSYFKAAAQEQFQATTPELLQPIEGVTLEAYASIVGQLVAGGDLDTLVRQAGMDRAKYDRVAEGWGARMAQDDTFVVTTAYGAAFTAASNQARGTENGPSMSWERFIEVQEAMTELTKIGLDPQTILQQLGTTLAAYSADGMHYSEWFNANAARDPDILRRYDEYSKKYQAKYAAAKQDQDLQF